MNSTVFFYGVFGPILCLLASLLGIWHGVSANRQVESKREAMRKAASERKARYQLELGLLAKAARDFNSALRR